MHLHEHLHGMIITWFSWLDQWGYTGIVILMAMESSIIPVPSELVIPPAAFWASQGRMSLAGVVLAGTVGSYIGSAISYLVSRAIGVPLVERYGKYFGLNQKNWKFTERWVHQHGFFGIFLARLLPVIRHLISIPAGIFEMPFLKFSLVTTAGAGIWCTVLAWFGKETIGSHPELLQTPAAMVSVVKDKLSWFAIAVAVTAVLYAWISWIKNERSVAKSPKAI